MTAPRTNSTSASKMTRLRPNLSAIRDENGEISRASSAVHDVIIDLSHEVRARFDRDAPMDTRVAEMIPVSSSQKVSC
jgi:hypothetical protein